MWVVDRHGLAAPSLGPAIAASDAGPEGKEPLASLARFFHLAAIRPDKSRGPGDPARGRYVGPDCGVKPPTL
jgi:hypothetical protein